METEMVSEVTSYRCNYCGELYNREGDADKCALKHAKTKLANTLLHEGQSLQTINYLCGFNWNLKESQKDITQDNCFIISHWQCCEEPAYQIVAIEDGGYLRMWGKGGWSGGYGNSVSPDKLPEPHPKEELFIYK